MGNEDVPPANPLTGAMRGLRVLDFSQIAAGPLCSMLLADMGADVVKVEAPTGDIARGLGPPFVNGESALFLSLNRNKFSVVVDLKTAEGQARIAPLIAEADVVIESFRPGVAKRLGIGFEAVRQLAPDAIYCSISAYGQSGSWSKRAGVDGVIQAISGLMSITGDADSGPSKVQAPVVDMATGLQATIAILAALGQRSRGEQTAHLDVNLFGSALMLQQIPFASYLLSSLLPVRTGSGAPYATPNEAYRTADGHILIAAYQDRHWRRLCTTIAREDLIDRPEYADLAARLAHRAKLTETLNDTLAMRPTTAWLALLEQQGITCAPVADYAMVADMPHLAESGALATVPHAPANEMTMPGFTIGGRAIPVRHAPPKLGEHDTLSGWPHRETSFARPALPQLPSETHPG